MKIAIFGCGTIGSGVLEIVNKLTCDIHVAKVFDFEEKRKFIGDILETDYSKILEDDSIDLIVETLGGISLADKIIRNALKRGKHVVTANKQVVALYLNEYIKLAKENNVYFLFEASVGGGIPVIKALSNVLKYDKVGSIYGIMNGTTNYILTQMQKHNTTLEDAILMAQALGYAERDPSADLLGIDMVAKISILAMLATNKYIDRNEIVSMGINDINTKFIDFVKDEELVCKIVAEAIKLDDSYHIDIVPVVVNPDSLLAQTNNAFNSIFLECEDNGKLLFNGLGAGKNATATAVVSDVINVFENYNYINYSGEEKLIISNNKLLRNYFVMDHNNKISYIENASLDDLKEYKFYALDLRKD